MIAWITKNNLSESDQHSTKELTLVFVAWLGAVAFCALMLLLASIAQDFLQALAAMALPLVVVLVAAYLLFFNDQGRELGVGLMIGDRVGLWRARALVFCANLLGLQQLAQRKARHPCRAAKGRTRRFAPASVAGRTATARHHG